MNVTVHATDCRCGHSRQRHTRFRRDGIETSARCRDCGCLSYVLALDTDCLLRPTQLSFRAVYSMAGRVSHWKLPDSRMAFCGVREGRTGWLLTGADEPSCRKCARYDHDGTLKPCPPPK